MGDLTLGAVGAALIAALISVLSLIISKEQKVSEFRQKWIDDLRECLISYNSAIHSVVDEISIIKKAVENSKENQIDLSTLKKNYVELNKAANGIKLRINYKEKRSKKILKIMNELESLSKNNDTFTVENISKLENQYIKSAQKLLKFEWSRVKKGEITFIITKFTLLISFLVILIYLIYKVY